MTRSSSQHGAFFLALWALAGLAHCTPSDETGGSLEDAFDEANPPRLLPMPPPCEVAEASALARAGELERMALAHWERVPFAVGEGPEALWLMSWAERCYVLAGDLAGGQRAHASVDAFARELHGRMARARLLLELALRQHQAEGVHRLATELLDLLSRSGSDVEPYRAWLQHQRLAARARATELLAQQQKD